MPATAAPSTGQTLPRSVALPGPAAAASNDAAGCGATDAGSDAVGLMTRAASLADGL